MISAKNKTMATTAVMVLMLATSAALISIPIVKAPTTLTLSTHLNQFIGQNSETVIIWTIIPNMLATDPNYIGKTSAWANANVTFTRPDGTKNVVSGPLTIDPAVPQGVAVDRFVLYYTPNAMGNWVVNLYWPGDSTYNAVNKTDSFYVGGHIPKRNVYAMLSLNPYPVVGLGQDLLINAWITPPPATNYQAFYDYMFTFKRPDGTSFTVGPMDAESAGTVWFDLPLDALGNWTIKFEFPGDYMNLPASVTRTITVQQEALPSYPDNPLPTESWKFPINVQNRQWRTISGEWLQSFYNASMGSFNPSTEAPRTAHILWKLPAYTSIGGYVGDLHSIQTGGAVEGTVGDVGVFQSGVPSIRTVMAGRGYYTAGGNIICVDMRTGQTLWSVPGSFSVGATRSTYGPVLYNFGTRFIVYDGMSGSMILNVTGMSMNFFVDPYAYTYQRTNATTGEGYWIKWDTTGTSNDFSSRIIWNQTNVLAYSTNAHCLIQGNLMISRHFLTEGVQNYGVSSSNTIIVDYLTAVNLTTGKMEWNTTIADPTDPTTWLYRQGPAWGSGEGLVYFAGYGDPNEGRGYIAFNAATGKLAWWSEEADYPWGNFWAYTPQACAYNMVIGIGYSGVYAFNATNGKIVWRYVDNNTYFEEPYASNINSTDGSTYSSYTFGSTGPVIGGGIIFAPNTEHSPTFAYRGMGLDAIDAYTGQQVWRILGAYDTPTAIAYGILLVADSWNGYTYAFGKGDTATTLSTSSNVIAKGDSMLLEGTVLDMSSAQKGTAAVSDADQEAWMEYLHMQQPFPVNAKGVTVSLDALDPNGNFIHIGDATSDTTGKYSFLWEPEIEGKYTIVASFYSTEAYYSSTAETAIGVTAAAATPTPTPGPQAAPDYTLSIIGVGVAMLIAIAVATVLLLRKRP
jgi:outer membrane protein assembly factor BamB